MNFGIPLYFNAIVGGHFYIQKWREGSYYRLKNTLSPGHNR